MFDFPLDKLGVVNSALSQCGDNLCSVVDDGSDEWTTASPAYERALGYIMENHTWGFATKVSTLTASATVPTDDQYDTAYNLPPDLVHLIWVRIDDRPCLWDILAGQLVVNAQGGPPPPSPAVTPLAVTAKYVSQDRSDPTYGTPTMVLALISMVMSGIYRGLHEDPGEANKMWAGGVMMLQEARSRYDMQKPKRSMFNSRVSAARRIRRPWPPVGNNSWGGSGSPG
ncbi:MAG: hypothetical protein ABIO35_08295 [Nitrobacter sp.]